MAMLESPPASDAALVDFLAGLPAPAVEET